MHPSAWVRDRITALAKNHAVVWVEDPYRLLDRSDAEGLSADLRGAGQAVAVVANAYRLREFLGSVDPVASSPRFVVVDQSYTTRDPHLLPQDAKPADLVPLAAPDWKPSIPADARFRPTARDFLIEATGFDDWPNEVNIYPYERLARSQPAGFVSAYESFRSMGRTLPVSGSYGSRTYCGRRQAWNPGSEFSSINGDGVKGRVSRPACRRPEQVRKEGCTMTLAELIYQHSLRLPEPAAREALDFIEFLEQRYGVAGGEDAGELSAAQSDALGRLAGTRIRFGGKPIENRDKLHDGARG